MCIVLALISPTIGIVLWFCVVKLCHCVFYLCQIPNIVVAAACYSFFSKFSQKQSFVCIVFVCDDRVLRTYLTVGAGVAGGTLTGVGAGVVDAHATVQTRAALTVVNICGIHPRVSDYTRYTYFNIFYI